MSLFATDIAFAFIFTDVAVAYRVSITDSALFGCCDFIAQAILIHRCWIVWGCNICVVIIPSILAFAYLVMWMAAVGSNFIEQTSIDQPVWGARLTLTSLTASMTVNAVVTGLIVFRIFKVFRKGKSVTTSEDKSFGTRPTRRNKLRSAIFIIIESGMALFAIQLARVVITATQLSTDAEEDAFQVIGSIHEMLNGIAPTVILVRVSLGLSFDNEESLVEAISGLQFATNDPNQIPGTGSIDQNGSLDIGEDDPNSLSEMYRERRDDESGKSDDIQIVGR